MTSGGPGVDLDVMSFRSAGLFALALAAGCARSAPPPTTAAAATPITEPAEAAPAADLSPNKLHDRRAEAGVRAAAKPLVIGNAASVKCGKITKADKDAESTELL